MKHTVGGKHKQPIEPTRPKYQLVIDQAIREMRNGKLLLSWQNVKDDGMNYLCQHNSKIKVIFMCQNSITKLGAEILSKTYWNHLTKISLSANKLGVKGSKYLSQGNWKLLSQLFIRSNNILDEGLSHLVKGDWPQLRIVHLGQNHLSKIGEYLKMSNWYMVETVYINSNQLKKQGIISLLQCNWLVIRQMDLSNQCLWKCQIQSMQTYFNKKYSASLVKFDKSQFLTQ